jgi:hypothetical protein
LLLICDLIKIIVPIEIEKNDKLSKLICDICLQQLLNAIRFRSVAVQNDFNTREKLKSNDPTSMIVLASFLEEKPSSQTNDEVLILKEESLEEREALVWEWNEENTQTSISDNEINDNGDDNSAHASNSNESKSESQVFTCKLCDLGIKNEEAFYNHLNTFHSSDW